MIVSQTENSITEEIMHGQLFKNPAFSTTFHTGRPFYKDNYIDNKEPWKNSDPNSVIDEGDILIYDKLPIEVTIFKNEKLGYQIRCKKTGSIKKVTLLKINDIDLGKVDLGKVDLSSTYKFIPEFQVDELGVRLWKNIEKEGPSSFQWLIENDGIDNLTFREEPEAFDKDSLEKITISCNKTQLDTTSFIFEENVEKELKESTIGIKVDTDFYSEIGGHIYGNNGTYLTARGTSTTADTNTFKVGQSTGYYIYRGFLRFDTSSLPDISQISTAKIGLICSTDYSTTDFDIDIVKCNWSGLSLTTNRETCYDLVLSSDKDVTWRNTSGMSTGVRYWSPELNYDYISRTSYTYYALRSAKDYAGTAPADAEHADFGGVASGNDRPLLQLTYFYNDQNIMIL